MNSLRSLLIGTLLAVALVANPTRAADDFKFEFHGFVTTSMYWQDQVFSNAQGQGLTLSAPSPYNAAPNKAGLTAAPAATKSASLLSGDLRNSRFSFSATGPKALGGTPKGYFEFDFFGLNGAGSFGTEQVIPRLRVAYAEMNWGSTVLYAGQANQLVVSQIPVSPSHIANPMTYGAGTIGWRTPGVRVTHAIPMEGLKLELAAEVTKNKWLGDAALAATGSQTTPATVGLGEAGTPMFQGRVKVDGKAGDLTYMGYVVGVYHSVQLDGFGASVALPAAAGGKKTLDGYVGEVGGKLTFQPVALAFNVYTGKATGNMLGAIVNFGDIKDFGYWAQLSVAASKEISFHALYGANTPNKDDVKKWVPLAATGSNATRLENAVYGVLAQYREAGYTLALEWYQNDTKWWWGTATANQETNTKANQILATVGYFF